MRARELALGVCWSACPVPAISTARAVPLCATGIVARHDHPHLWRQAQDERRTDVGLRSRTAPRLELPQAPLRPSQPPLPPTTLFDAVAYSRDLIVCAVLGLWETLADYTWRRGRDRWSC